MRKIKLIVSDFHLGRGRRLPDGSVNVLEDFFHDYRFKEFLEHYSTGKYEGAEIELIFNGDMLNLIQTDYHGHFPVVLTENVARHKMNNTIAGHPMFFDALRDFLKDPRHSLTYVVGNHDQEMLWKGARTILENAVGREITWKNTHYQIDGIHIEHGHQYEAVNRIDPTCLFLTEGLPEPILNLPWGTLFTIQFIVRIKQSRPHIDKIRPFRHVVWWSLFHDTWMAITSLLRLSAYFVATRFSKNRYRQSSLKTTFRILFEASVFPDLSDAARRILRSPELHTVVFGHTHVYKHQQYANSKQYLNLGTWTDIVSMELDSFGRRSRLTYARADYEEGAPHPTVQLRHWVGAYRIDDDAMSL